jgi:hypothetical protein
MTLKHIWCLRILQELIKFAYDEKIVLMADEVYQENIYQDERPFVSARKVRGKAVYGTVLSSKVRCSAAEYEAVQFKCNAVQRCL